MVNGSSARMHVRWKAIAAVVIAVAASVYMIGYSLASTLTVVLPAMIGIIVVWKLPAAKDPRPGAFRHTEFHGGATLC